MGSKQTLSCVRYLLTGCKQQDVPPVTIKEARNQLKQLVGSSKSWNEKRDAAVYSIKLATSQNELPAKVMTDSYREAVIPLGTNEAIRGKYVNFHNTVRVGRLMEDLDTMAVWIGYSHCEQEGQDKSPLSIVTGMVDRIELNVSQSIHQDLDILLRGHVTWAGSSSLEVTMNVEQEVEGSIRKVLEAQFLMVARNPSAKCKAFVHPLEWSTPEEQAIIDLGEKSKVERENERKDSLLKHPPSERERLVIHNLFLETLDVKAMTFKAPVKPAGSVWMEQTLLKNVIICFPEQRNLYNKIFGGFLMRQAFELGWANACVYSKSRVYTAAVDDIMFQKPVEVGALLYFSSQIVYTEGPYLQVKVHAEVVDPATGEHQTTNIFHFTFTTKTEDVPVVMPKSYAEYMMFLDGKRHFESGSSKSTL